MEGELKNYYHIIIATHKPDRSKLGAICKSIDHLLIKDKVRVIIIASGDRNSMQCISDLLKSYKGFLRSNFLTYRCSPNYGIPHKWNLGIKLAMAMGAELVTLLTDDSFPINCFDSESISNYYFQNCDLMDLMLLPSHDNDLVNDHKRLFVYDSGMTFSKELARKLSFDEKLVHSFTDYKFSFQVATKLGKIVIFPQIVIGKFEPHATTGEIAYHPNWILYLIFRDSIYWARSESSLKHKILILAYFILCLFQNGCQKVLSLTER